jgi:hypothetical protein
MAASACAFVQTPPSDNLPMALQNFVMYGEWEGINGNPEI